jgi:GNAT superfamily N-acetyltransferase
MIYADKLTNPFLFIQPKNIEYDVKSLLGEYNFHHVGQVTCVLINHSNFDKDDENNGGKIVCVNNTAKFEDWCHIVEVAYNMKKGMSRQVFEPCKPYLFSEDSEHKLFILYHSDGTPISASLLYLPKDKNREAGHYCWGTDPKYRNKGAMSFLVKEMIRIAKEAGFSCSVAQCYDQSLNIAKKVGFQAQEALEVFSNMAYKST